MAKSLTGAIVVLASWVDLCVVATQGAKVSKVSIRLLLRFFSLRQRRHQRTCKRALSLLWPKNTFTVNYVGTGQ